MFDKYHASFSLVSSRLPRLRLGIVFDFNNGLFSENSSFYLKTHHKINNGQLDFFDSVGMDPGNVNEFSLNSDHVFAWYFCPKYVRSETTISSEDWVEASFDFMLHRSSPKIVRLKRCGVSLLYAQDFYNLFGSINNQSSIDEDVVMELSGDAIPE